MDQVMSVDVAAGLKRAAIMVRLLSVPRFTATVAVAARVKLPYPFGDVTLRPGRVSCRRSDWRTLNGSASPT